MLIEDRFRKDLVTKIEELKQQKYLFLKDGKDVIYAKPTNAPVGESGYFNDLIKYWLLKESKKLFDDIIQEEINKYIFEGNNE